MMPPKGVTTRSQVRDARSRSQPGEDENRNQQRSGRPRGRPSRAESRSQAQRIELRGQTQGTESQAADSPIMATADEVAELRQIIERQAEESRKREEDWVRRQAEMFEEFLRRVPVNNAPQNVQEPPPPPAHVPDPPAAPLPVPAPQPVPVEGQIGNQKLKPISERFRKQNPPVFNGEADPYLAEEWMSMLEKIFDFIDIEDKEKVSCAVYMLRNDGRIWWDAIRKSRNVAEMTWFEFQTLFNCKYFSKSMLDYKVHEFTNLQQGTMTV